MRVLLVEDNSFIAFCLTRFLKEALVDAHVSVVKDADSAYQAVTHDTPDLLILDGHLSDDARAETGPEIADKVWQAFPDMAIVACTDSESMKGAFKTIFERHQKAFDKDSNWPKNISDRATVSRVYHKIQGNYWTGRAKPAVARLSA